MGGRGGAGGVLAAPAKSAFELKFRSHFNVVDWKCQEMCSREIPKI